MPSTELRTRLGVLVGRLDNGLVQIERAKARGQDVVRWEDAWVGLLQEYERVWDALAAQGGEAVV